MTKPVLSLQNIRKSYESELVLQDISLDVFEHKATVLIGASGSGKSTILRCINLLVDIDDGAIFLDDEEISNPLIDIDKTRRRMGMVFQSFNLFPHMNVLENITLAPIKAHKMSKAQATEIALELLKDFDLQDKAYEYPDKLSGGQQQRVAIIRSIATNPRVLLLDEVTSALDPVLVGEVLSVVKNLKSKGMTMVIATHEMNFATQVADEVCYLDRGKIVERGPASKVILDPQNIKTKEFLKTIHDKNTRN
jgi:polar amino acid transport system ATP-binding protein